MTSLRQQFHLGAAALLFLPALTQAQIAFDPATNVGVGQRPDGLAAGDFSGDGLADIAVVTDSPDKVDILLGAGACGLSGPFSVFLPNGSSPADLVAGDFNGNGHLDLAVSLKGPNQVRLLLNQGNGTFSLGSSAPTGDGPRHMASADLNGDGTPDLATSNREDNTVSIFTVQGGVPTNVGTYAAGDNPRGIALGDVTGNGLADLVVASHDTREIHVRANLGGAVFGAPTVLSVGFQLRPDGVALADVNGDGLLDILAATSGNGMNFVSIFTNLGGGAFGGMQNFSTGGQNPDSLVAADLDGDGDMDIAVTNQDSNTVTILTNNGGGSFGAPILMATGTRPGAIVAVDLGANGGVDLVTSNRDSNNLSVFCNQNTGGPTTYCVAAPNSAGPGAQIGSSGSLSVAANSFALNVSGAVAGEFGIFFAGSTQTQTPLGDGFLCAAGDVVRMNPPQLVGAGGSAARPIDFNSVEGSQFLAGSTWNFQFWYRDSAAGGAGFNFSNGLSATFQP